MALPEAVRRAGERADALIEEARQQALPATDGQPQAAGSGRAEAAPSDAAHQRPRTDEDPNAQTWRARFETLQGKYNAEVHADVKAMSARLESLAGEVRSLNDANARLQRAVQERPAPAQQAPPTAPVQLDQASLKTLRDDYPDIAPAFESLHQLAANQTAELERLRGNVTQVSNDARSGQEERFWQGLTERVPDWEAVNATPSWQAYLGQVDPFTGKPRQALLDQAQQSLDVTRVAAFFADYQRQPAPATRNTQQERLAAQAQPDAGAGGNPPNETQAHYTGAQIKAFYDELKFGRERYCEAHGYTAAQLAAYERDIVRASQEGRVR